MLRQVDIVAPIQKSSGSSGRKGGGALGTKAGLAAGLIGAGAIAATGGAAAPAVLGAAATGGLTGASLGGMLGEAIRPGREAQGAIERRLSTVQPTQVHSDSSERLKQSLMALHEAPPDVRQAYAKPLTAAYLSSLSSTPGGGVA